MTRPDDEPAVDATAAGTAADDDGWHVDPDAPQGVDATLDAMGQDLRRLTRSSLLATVGVALVLFLVELAGSGGQGGRFDLTKGFVVGGGLATVNLWVLAGGYFAIVDGRATAARVALASVGSLALLLGVALWIVLAHRGWSVGFGLGLAVPALGGIVYALTNPEPRRPG